MHNSLSRFMPKSCNEASRSFFYFKLIQSRLPFAGSCYSILTSRTSTTTRPLTSDRVVLTGEPERPLNLQQLMHPEKITEINKIRRKWQQLFLFFFFINSTPWLYHNADKNCNTKCHVILFNVPLFPLVRNEENF